MSKNNTVFIWRFSKPHAFSECLCINWPKKNRIFKARSERIILGKDKHNLPYFLFGERYRIYCRWVLNIVSKETLEDERMFERNSFQSLGAMTEKAEKAHRIKENEQKTRLDK